MVNIANFKFHPVGQGLFYTGAINKIQFVFDLGSEKISLINKRIDEYFNNRSHIHLLIISHLHFDHVSGLKQLKDRGIKVDKVILPYLYPIERLIIYSSSPDRSWYIDFLENPTEYLSVMAKEIIYIRRDDIDLYSDDIEGFPEKPISPENEENKVHLILSNCDDKTLNQIKKFDSKIFNKKVSIFSDKGFISIGSLWKFKLFNYPLPGYKLELFRRQIKKLLQKDFLEFRSVVSENVREHLVKIYENLSKNLNITSLAIYHGPFNKSACWMSSYNSNLSEIEASHHEMIHSHKNASIGTLLLGDIKVNYVKKSSKLFKHFNSDLENIRLVQLSHHGAENGWHRHLLSQLPNARSYIFSYGIKNKYGHPSWKVLKEILDVGRNIYSVNEKSMFKGWLGFL